jgi:hypothetical protein
MRPSALLASALLLALPAMAAATEPNPAIDMPGYLRISGQAAEHRETRRLSEDDFLRMSREPGTIVLDARSQDKFDELHLRGAIHLAFTDFTADNLAAAIPDKATRILIYCNNNFGGAPGPFALKAAAASLNLSTYIALYTYGYRNVYELGPYLEVAASRLEFEGSAGVR